MSYNQNKKGNTRMNTRKRKETDLNYLPGIHADIIAIASKKGGTGKTTICYNMAGILAETKKVLLIDMDQQCNLSSNVGFDIFNPNSSSVADIFDNSSIDPTQITMFHPIPELPNLDVIPSTMFLEGTEINLASVSMREMLLFSYMQKNTDFFNYYDYIMFDTPPSMGICTQNAFFVADHIIIITDPNCNSARCADVFLTMWGNFIKMARIENRVDALILNNMERTNISSMTDDYINNHEVFSKIRLKHMIPHTTRFKECDEQNKTIQFLKCRTKQMEQSREKAEIAIRDMIHELEERGIL